MFIFQKENYYTLLKTFIVRSEASFLTIASYYWHLLITFAVLNMAKQTYTTQENKNILVIFKFETRYSH